jgi:hypothetical protein
MCRRADQANQSAFNIEQQGILLGFIESMNFVDKQDRFRSLVFQTKRCHCQDPANITDAAFYRAHTLELAAGRRGNNLSKAGLTYARRAV